MPNKMQEKLKNYREEKKLTHKEMADLAGISKSYYWQIENGNRRLYYDLALKLAKILGKKPDDIFYDYYK